ncbi:MAG: NAD(P)/FAD-dependent oxidoreductase [Anaerolineaceae bacterium]
MGFDTVIVGAGASGLTAAAYLAKYGHSVLLCEKEANCGGLINSFTRDGFTFDGGIRALEDAGVFFTMLRHLDVEMEFVKNHVSMGIEDQMFNIESENSIDDYSAVLKKLYPDSTREIELITKDLHLISRAMDIQYGINNPLFLDPKEDGKYFATKVFPWLIKYALNVGKVQAKAKPVVPYLRQFTSNQALLDIITQHFFAETPAYFALSYFRIFQEYYYPKGGTGVFIDKMTALIHEHGGVIRTKTEIQQVDPIEKTITTSEGETITYRHLLWTADQKRLYNSIALDSQKQPELSAAINERKTLLADKTGNDSIFSLFLTTDLDPSFYQSIAAGHVFYTPSRTGQSAAGPLPLSGTRGEIEDWLRKYLALTTYEISIPVLRDPDLAPPGKTGLIISILFDFNLTKRISDQGWYEEFKQLAADVIVDTLDRTLYPGLAAALTSAFSATPLTLQEITGATDGAITGWSFRNNPVPAEYRLARIANAVNTIIPDISQAGQWTYSPSGLPVSLITGKVAADKIHKLLGRE